MYTFVLTDLWQNANVINAIRITVIHLLEQFILILCSPEFTSMFTSVLTVKNPAFSEGGLSFAHQHDR